METQFLLAINKLQSHTIEFQCPVVVPRWGRGRTDPSRSWLGPLNLTGPKLWLPPKFSRTLDIL